jgi:hypothetical protein
MTPTDLPHPFEHDIPRERLEREYLNVTIDRCPDSKWRFRLNLHRAMRVAPGGDVPPTAAAPFQTLVLLQRPQPLADVEIFGLDLPAEVHPADWLDLWLQRHGMVAVSSRPIATPRGNFGDAVCTWDTPDGPFAGRFAAMKWGRRTFLITLRAPRANYAAVAEDFFVALSSFVPLDVDEPNLLAEPVQVARIAAPITATVSLPVSYAMESDLADPRVSAFGAEQQAIAAMPDDPAFGKLNFLVAQAALADHPAQAAALYLAALMPNPILLGGDEFL